MRFSILLPLFIAAILITSPGYTQKPEPKKTENQAPKKKQETKEKKQVKQSNEKKEVKVSKKKKEKKTTTVVKEGQPETEIRAGLGFFAGFPLGDFNKDVYTGYGVNLDGEYFLRPELSVGLNLSYAGYKHDEIHIGKGRYSIIPIQLRGAWYFLDGDFHPFAGLNAGLFITKSKYDSIIEPRTYVDPNTGLFIHSPGGVKDYEKKASVWGITPMAGIVYKVADKVWVNVHVRYNLIFTEKKSTNVIGIHIGACYSFGI
ncbi:MAG: outer membrane beta-barrel protein [Bacteroidetes bacterium]|nr:outer membrane beta-barrel protein [Bacteroidota bacterium]